MTHPRAIALILAALPATATIKADAHASQKPRQDRPGVECRWGGNGKACG